VTRAELSDIYRGYIACLNKQDWPNLGQFVHEDVRYNDKRVGLSGYREMLERDFRAIPDLYFDIRLLVSEPPRIASRLHFDCTPIGELFGLPVNGKKVQFAENVFYAFLDGRIETVWSIIDKATIEAQL
jgi:predicted ester cyclase